MSRNGSLLVGRSTNNGVFLKEGEEMGSRLEMMAKR